jgi:demethylmenaquinone methyltransferase/2-methoxy-6-polyprenyl-1,4-benzoquinol methylase
VKTALDRADLKAVYDRVAKRYDFQHALFTAGSDQRGRALVVEKTVSSGDRVLDAGAGTGSTGLLAAQKTGPSGEVTLFDMSEAMLGVARKRAAAADPGARIEFCTGDIATLPFEDHSFDAALSTYSICPLYSPSRGAMELYRVVRPGGRVGIAHSAAPEAPRLRWLADKVEGLAWRFPSISLGCRAVSVLPLLERAGARVLFSRRIGVPLWPFMVLVVEKPAA